MLSLIRAQTEAPDFWGVVLPAYLGALGAIISGGVATFALIRDIGTRKGLATIAQDANDRAVARPIDVPAAPAVAAPVAGRDAPPPLPGRPHKVPFEIRTLTRGLYVLRNVTDHPVRLLGISTAGRTQATFSFDLPLEIAPGEGYELHVHHPLGGPAIVTVTFTFEDKLGIRRWEQFL